MLLLQLLDLPHFVSETTPWTEFLSKNDGSFTDVKMALQLYAK